MTEKEYEYILNPKTGKLVKTCGNIGMKLIKNYEYEEIYNPETKRTVNFNKTTGKKVYKKYEKYIEKYSKKGGAVATAAITCPASIHLPRCIKPEKNSSQAKCSLHKYIKDQKSICSFELAPQNGSQTVTFIEEREQEKYNTIKTQENTSSFKNSYSDPQLNVPEDLSLVIYSYDNKIHIVSSSLNTVNGKIVVDVEQYDYFQNPPNPPNPPISTRKYQFNCEPSNTNENGNGKQVCNSSSMQTNETLKKFLQILAAYIDTIVMLLNPQFLSIFTGEWLKNVVIEYIFTYLLQLVIPTQIDNKGLLVKSVVWNMMGDNVITISAKLTLKTFAYGYTENLPQVIIKKNINSTFENFVKTKTLTSEQETNIQKLLLEQKTKTKIQTLPSEVKKIVDTISVNFDITVKE